MKLKMTIVLVAEWFKKGPIFKLFTCWPGILLPERSLYSNSPSYIDATHDLISFSPDLIP